VLLNISTRAQKYTISLHGKLDASGLLLDRDEAFALDLALREICRHIIEIAVPGIIIPIAGSASEEGYTIELASVSPRRPAPRCLRRRRPFHVSYLSALFAAPSTI